MVRMATIVTQVRPAVYRDHKVVVTLLDFLAADEHQRDPLQFRDRTLGLTAAAFASLLKNKNELHLVAEVGSHLAGYARAHSWRQASADGEITLLWPRPAVHLQVIVVAPTHRLCGVGRALFAAVEVWAAELDAEYIGLNVSAHNTGAKLFYASLGYAATSEYLTKTICPVRRVEKFIPIEPMTIFSRECGTSRRGARAPPVLIKLTCARDVEAGFLNQRRLGPCLFRCGALRSLGSFAVIQPRSVSSPNPSRCQR